MKTQQEQKRGKISAVRSLPEWKNSVPTNRFCIVVLGMHRSGTSALTRVLSLLGCDLPKTLMGANKSNETGHWESTNICRLNDRILESAGTNWYDWLEFNQDWLRSPKAEEFRQEALKSLKQEFGRSHLFVLKDPRICRLVPFWVGVLEEFGTKPLIIFHTRNPLEVASSLQNRNGFSSSFGHLLWLRHVLAAEFASRGMPRYFTSYDCLMKKQARVVAEAQSALGISWPRKSAQVAAEIEVFLSQKHRHHHQSSETIIENPTLSKWLRDSFRILDSWAVAGENSEAFRALDQIRHELDTSAPAFSQLIAAGLKADQKIQELERALSDMRASLNDAEKAIPEQRQITDRLKAQLAATRHEVKGKEQQISRLHAEQDGWIRLAQGARQELYADRDRLAQTEHALAKSRLEVQQKVAELAAARAECRRMDTARRETEKLVSNLKDHIELLTANVEQQQVAHVARLHELDTQVKGKDKELEAAQGRVFEADAELKLVREQMVVKQGEQEQEISRLKRDIDKKNIELTGSNEKHNAKLQNAAAEKRGLEAALKDRFDEIVTLTSLLREVETEAFAKAGQIEHMRETYAKELNRLVTTFLDSARWPVLTGIIGIRRQMDLLRRSGLFDAEWYSRHYTDVAEAGVDPLRHYVKHGAKEGRKPNATLARSNGTKGKVKSPSI